MSNGAGLQSGYEREADAFEADSLEADSFEFNDESEFDQESEEELPLDEVEEMELAAQLLEITTEEELDQFLGSLFKKVWRGVKKIGKPLGGLLKKVAKVALPIAGTAAGTFFGGPVGGMIGGKLASGATKLFGLELEGMSPEDQEFEVARRFVRLAASAAKNAQKVPPGAASPKAAKRAVIKAARRHAPGLLRRRRGGGGRLGKDTQEPDTDGADNDMTTPGSQRSYGRWIRRGRQVIIFNCK
jgi:hypothetical protein